MICNSIIMGNYSAMKDSPGLYANHSLDRVFQEVTDQRQRRTSERGASSFRDNHSETSGRFPAARGGVEASG